MSQSHVPLFRSPLVGEVNTKHTEVISSTEKGEPDATAEEINEYLGEPVFQHHAETTNLQLFFDLFFVANLNSFNEGHDVNSGASLASYIGFFCVLWFTWCQVTLYDVRFITDSISERLAHACHFGVMVGLAVVGPGYNELDHHPPWILMRKLCIVLIISRSILFFQYGSILLYVWKFKSSRTPLIATLATFVVSIVVYAGVLGAIGNQSSAYAYLGWYIIFLFEVSCSIAIGAHWPLLSFKGTHLIERMTCLSLIILGEGVIGVCKSIVQIEKYDDSFSSTAIGGITCSVLIIYLVYILYFDNVPEKDFGSVRQHIWACLHFPFHATLVLLTEGASEFVAWRHAIEYVSENFVGFEIFTTNTTYTNAEVYHVLNTTLTTVVFDGPFSMTYDDVEVVNTNLEILSHHNTTLTQITDAAETIEILLFRTVFEAYGFEPHDLADIGHDAGTTDVYLSYLNLFEFFFGYFFICGGLTLIWIGILSLLAVSNLEHKKKWRYLSIGTNIALGLGLCLLSLLVLTSAATTLGGSPWTISICVFILLACVIVDQVSRRLMKPAKEK